MGITAAPTASAAACTTAGDVSGIWASDRGSTGTVDIGIIVMEADGGSGARSLGGEKGSAAADADADADTAGLTPMPIV